MVIYYSMILWIMFMGLLNSVFSIQTTTSISRKYSMPQRKIEYKPIFIFAILSMAYIVFWVGIRTGVADTNAYIKAFNALNTDFMTAMEASVKDSGFTLFSYIIKVFISDNYHVFLMAIAAISGLCVFIPLYKKSPSFYFSMMLFMLSGIFTWMLNGIRQFMAAAVLFACYKFIEQGKFFKFLIVVLLMSTIHSSCIIMIPVYFMVRSKPWGYKVVLFIVAIIFAIQFMEPLLNLLGMALEDTSYSGVVDNFTNDDGVHPLRVIIAVIPALIGLFKKRQIEEMNDPFLNICINMSLLAAGVYLLGVFTSGIYVGRIPIYFTLYSLISLPYLFKRCFREDEQLFLYVACFAGYVADFLLERNNLFYISEFTGLVK